MNSHHKTTLACNLAFIALMGCYGPAQADDNQLDCVNQKCEAEQFINALAPSALEGSFDEGLAGSDSGLTLRGGRKSRNASKRPAQKRVLLAVKFNNAAKQVEDEAKPILDALGKALSDPRLNSKPLNFRIEAHTNEVGKKANNKRLSEQQAQAVMQYLVENFAIDPKRLTPVGKGNEESIASNLPDEIVTANIEIVPVRQDAR
jgi:outer membrane protein OmpA-like peptidoglycan-associated protein